MPAPVVMLMTLNEKDNLPSAIKSFPEGTRIILYDSFSTDGTVELAREMGVTQVVQRKFDHWSGHQNWGAQNINFGSEWVYYTDADEHMTPELWAQICAAVENPQGHSAFEMRRKDMFMGRWIKHSSFYPCWFQRLYRPEKIRWERTGHVVAKVDGTVGQLSEHFIHYPFSKGMSHWFTRHVGYANLESRDMQKELGESVQFGKLFTGNHRERRRTLKHIFYKLPGRPGIKFLWLYFVRRGFLDGRAGFHFALMMACYEYMITLHKLELDRRNKGLPV